MKQRKSIILVLLVGLLAPAIGCKKYLNVNSDPDTIQEPSPSSVLPPMLANMAYGLQRDGRYISKYIANFHAYSSGITDATYDNHGYTFSSTNMGDTWWSVYYGLGKNLNYIIEKGLKTEQYDYVGVAYAIKAWSFQALTDEHGEVIYNEAWRDTTYFFHYDPQEVVYRGVDSLCRIALHYMDTAAVQTITTLKTGDLTYMGDLKKWRKFVYGVLARNYNHLSNKAGVYNADSVIKFCDNSFTSTNDDFVIPFDGTRQDNSNYMGPFRNTMNLYRQSNFIIKLLDGTTFTGSNAAVNRDPRIAHMLSASADTTNGNGGYYGINPGLSEQYVNLNPPGSYLTAEGQPPTSGTALTNWRNARKKTVTPYGDSIYAVTAGSNTEGLGKYLFRNKSVMPVMTYSEIQFIKAEAAYRKGLADVALIAYQNGINGHYDFINRSYNTYRSFVPVYNIIPISASDRARYLASDNVKKSAGTLRLTDIMLQKYIAMWGWGFLETWVDLRRYHYTDLDPVTTEPVYKNYTLPTTFANGKAAYRIRPNYQSEYVWNIDELAKWGGTKSDYHTIECWFSLP
ncbi:MAG TPA: SusD/RagB family nutrient-binding outer membrane lipoprotein [Niastella sp.]